MQKYKDLELIENKENQDCTVYCINNANKDALEYYKSLYEGKGYTKQEERSFDTRAFASYSDDNNGVFLNYFENVSQLYIVEEANTLYFSQNDQCSGKSVTPQITQIKLEDYGMSYVIRMGDGRFVIIDGGREFEPDATRLYECLKKSSAGDRPCVASWIMTHPHSDHFHCFLTFTELYGSQIDVQSFLFNFPEKDDFEHYPSLANGDFRFKDSSPFINIPKMYEAIETYGARIYTAHTGQTYKFADATFEILSSMDDTIHVTQNVNSMSLVIRMTLADQVVLWTADSSFSDTLLPEKYGNYLKSDMLQIPHHGFQSGTAEAQVRTFEIVAPEVAFLPVSDYNAFTALCIFKKGTRYLMEYADLKELITGETQKTIDLPYKADAAGQIKLQNNVKQGLASNGAYTHVFTGLHTSKEEDFNFSFLNMTHSKATVWIELYFDNTDENVRAIKLEVGSLRLMDASIIGELVDPDALHFNWLSLKRRGVSESKPFAVRFMSDIPIVITHKEHKATYMA